MIFNEEQTNVWHAPSTARSTSEARGVYIEGFGARVRQRTSLR